MAGPERAVRVLCRPELGVGFALAGLRTVEATNPAEGRERMQELLTDPDVGVVLVEEGHYNQFPDELRRRIGRRPLPMVVPFPEPVWEQGREPSEAYVVELLRQVIGYRVRLR
jgi:vacuolar-type H+-ATPase subunit F/Vma7